MAKGDVILSSSPTSVMNKIKEMRSKWGITNSNVKTFNSGNTANATDINTMIDWINEGKTKSGWSGSVPSKVNVSELITEITASLLSTAEAIRAHCPCNCNHCSCNCNRCDNCHQNCERTR